MPVLRCGNISLPLDRPRIMGIVNVTPDSFSDGGMHATTDAAVRHAETLIAAGADLVDIGGESTRPGSMPVPLDDERHRVLPVVEALAARGVPVSVDTQKPELMRQAIAAGASMINDINGFEAPGALRAVAAGGTAVCIMHKQGDPRTMQADPQYGDVVSEVLRYLRDRVAAAVDAGISRDRIAVDPGFGFGKTYEHNIALFDALREFRALGVALLAGLSRKSMLGRMTGRAVGDRMHASVAAALIAVQNGAHIVRVHDVAATRDALAVWNAIRGGSI